MALFSPHGLEGPGDLCYFVWLENIADLYVVEILDPHTAFETLSYLAGVVLESLETIEGAVVDLDSVPDHPHTRATSDYSLPNITTRDSAHAGYLEYLTYLGLSQDGLTLFRYQHSLEGLPHVFNGVINHAVGSDIHLLPLRGNASVTIRPHVKSDDHRIRCLGENHVALIDRSHSTVNHGHLNFVGRKSSERVSQGLCRAALVGLDNDVEVLDLPLLDTLGKLFEAHSSRCASVIGFPIETLAPLLDLANLL